MTRTRSFSLFAILTVSSSACGGTHTDVDAAAPTVQHAEQLSPIDDDGTSLEPATTEGALQITGDSIGWYQGARLLDLENGVVSPEARQGGEYGFRIPALSTELDSTESDSLVLAVQPDIPFHTVVEVVYTALQAGRSEFLFLVRRGDSVGAIPIRIPTISRHRAGDPPILGAIRFGDESPLRTLLEGTGLDDIDRAEDSVPTGSSETLPPESAENDQDLPQLAALNLVAHLTDAGIELSGSGGFLAPGCAEVGTRQVTVRNVDGEPDIASLVACLRRVESDFPEEELLVIQPDRNVHFAEFIRIVAAVRGPKDNPLFTDVVLAAGMR